MRDHLQLLVARAISPQATVRPHLRSFFEPAAPADGDLTTATDPVSDVAPPRLSAMDSESLEAFPTTAPSAMPSQRTDDATPRSSVALVPDLPSARVEPVPVEARKPDDRSVDDSSVTPHAAPLPDRESPVALPSVFPEEKVDGVIDRIPVRPAIRSIPAPPRVAASVERPVSQAVSAWAGSRQRPVQIIQPLSETTNSWAAQPGASPPVAKPARPSAPETRPAVPEAPGDVLESGSVEPESSREGWVSPILRTLVRPPVSVRTRSRASMPEPAAPETPTVHVTIGRVEVRATLASPVGSRGKVAAPAVMSLEEYLGKRAAGGQR